MKTIPLNNGIEIPQIGVGTWTLRGETARQNVRLALQAGFRHVDTAQGYENEAEVGLGIAESGVPRGEIFVTTKVATNITSAQPTGSDGRSLKRFQRMCGSALCQ